MFLLSIRERSKHSINPTNILVDIQLANMTRGPDWQDVTHRRQLASVGLTETLNLEKTKQTMFSGGWLPISTFAFFHQNSYFSIGDSVIGTDEAPRFRYQEPLPPVGLEEIERLRFYERDSILAADKYRSLEDHAQTVETDAPTVITYGFDETFWQALGAFEIAANEYIVFPEALSGRWTHGIPDLTCFQLGHLQEVLADIGLVPGGATLEEIELRSMYDKFDPTTIDVENSVGVAEAKGHGKASDGVRELTSHRGSRTKSPYLEGGSIQHGWLISPEAGTTIQSAQDSIGGVTWSEDGVMYQSPPKQAAQNNQQKSAARTAKRLVLDRVLRHQVLSASLNETIEACLKDPEHLYEVFET